MSSAPFLHFKPKIAFFFKINRRFSTPVDLAHVIHGSDLTKEPPFVILHGLIGSKKNWSSISKVLAQKTGRPVIAADLRNHGDSPHANSHTYKDLASDVELLLNKLSISKAIVIGHSMGGRTAMVLSMTKPQKVAAVIVVDIAPSPSTQRLKDNFFPNLFEAMSNMKFDNVPSISEARSLAKKNLSTLINQEETLNFIVMNLATDASNKVIWKLNINSLKQFYKNDIAGFPKDLESKHYPGPTLFIVGGHSDFVQKSDHRLIKKYFPSSLIQVISNAGHNVHSDAPIEFVDAVTHFIEQNEAKLSNSL